MMMNFGEAIGALEAGKFIARAGWVNQWLTLHKSNQPDRMEVRTPSGERLPWHAGQDDMLAKDWLVVDGVVAEAAGSTDVFLPPTRMTPGRIGNGNN